MIRCECKHSRRSHYNSPTEENAGRCGVPGCICAILRGRLECDECGEILSADEGTDDDGLCCGGCGTEFAREREDIRNESAYDAKVDRELGVL